MGHPRYSMLNKHLTRINFDMTQPILCLSTRVSVSDKSPPTGRQTPVSSSIRANNHSLSSLNIALYHQQLYLPPPNPSKHQTMLWQSHSPSICLLSSPRPMQITISTQDASATSPYPEEPPQTQTYPIASFNGIPAPEGGGKRKPHKGFR